MIAAAQNCVENQYNWPQAIVYLTSMIILVVIGAVSLYVIHTHKENKIVLSLDDIYANMKDSKTEEKT